MLSNNQLKFVRSLHQAKYRKQNRLFLAEGPKLVSELLESQFIIKTILCTENWRRDPANILPVNTEVHTVSPKELNRISTLKTPNEVVAVVEMKSPDPEAIDPEKELILVLDGIRDPGNLGTILRTADWFGFRTIVCSPDCVELYNPKVVQATMGSITRVQVLYQDLISLFQKHANFPVYGALLNGGNVFRMNLQSRGFLVIGNESRGISEGLISWVTDPVSIPSMHIPKGKRAESLNASVAAAILCAEFRRRSYAESRFQPYEGSEPS